jgi:thiol-disulfide isomerase/thioredoxin
MKLKKSLLSLALLPLLLSCQRTPTYSVCLNGDLTLLGNEDLTYESVCESRDMEDLLAEADAGHPILLAVTSQDCSHCAEFEPIFTEFVVKYQLDVALLERSDGQQDLDFSNDLSLLEEHFPSFDFTGFGTPSILYLEKDKLQYFQQGLTDLGHLENILKGQASPLSGLTRYEKEAAIPYGKEEPAFLYDRNNETAASFYESVWAKAKSSSKVFRLIDYGAMDESNQKAVLAHYSLASYQPILVAEHIPYLLENEKEMASATSYLTTYYQ